MTASVVDRRRRGLRFTAALAATSGVGDTARGAHRQRHASSAKAAVHGADCAVRLMGISLDEVNLDLGRVSVRRLGRDVATEGETSSGSKSTGSGRLYELVGQDGLRLTLRDTTWNTGERDVVACDRHESPQRFDTLIERLRLSVLDYGSAYVELKQARLRPNGRAGLFNATPENLNAGAGVDVTETLVTLGATAVGTRRELLHDEGRTAGRYGTLFPSHAHIVPIAAYVLTRVLPIARGVSA